MTTHRAELRARYPDVLVRLHQGSPIQIAALLIILYKVSG